jgi:hypothetical protein
LNRGFEVRLRELKSLEGSVEPVAWAVVSDSTEQIDCEFVYPDETTAGDVALDSNGGVVLSWFSVNWNREGKA